MDIDFLNQPSMTNMNENDLFKTIKGQKGDREEQKSERYKAAIKKELHAFRESWSCRSKEELLEALLKIKKCELEMRLGYEKAVDIKN